MKPKVDPVQAVRMYYEGYTIDEIADFYGVVASHVSRVLRREGVPLTLKGTETEKKIDAGKIRALWKAGWSVTGIMFDCNCTKEEVEEVINAERNKCA